MKLWLLVAQEQVLTAPGPAVCWVFVALPAQVVRQVLVEWLAHVVRLQGDGRRPERSGTAFVLQFGLLGRLVQLLWLVLLVHVVMVVQLVLCVWWLVLVVQTVVVLHGLSAVCVRCRWRPLWFLG